MAKSMKRIFVLLFVVIMVVALAACGGAKTEAPAADTGASEKPAATEETPEAAAPASDVTIGKIPITLKHDVHGNDAKWAKIYAAEKYGATYEVIDCDQDLNKEIAAVETFISRGFTGIILHPVTEDGVNDIIQEARDAGVYIMTYNVEASGKKVPALLIDESEVAAQMGADMCKQWIELYPDKPVKIGLVSWTDIAFCFDNRTGPFLKGAKTVVDYLPTDDWGFVNSAGDNLTGATYWEHAGGNLEKAIEVTSAALIKHPDVNIIYGDNVSNGLGVVAAYEAAGRGTAIDGIPQTEIIASTDASDGELNKLADPTSSLKYCLGMQPQTFAYAQIDMIMEIINGQIDDDTYIVRTTPDVYFNYYKDSLQQLQDWYNTQYMPDTPIDLVGTFGA